MLEQWVGIVLIVLAAYAAAGVLFAVAFHAAGARRVDAGVAGAGFLFRLLITPGVIALWPVLARRWRMAAAGRGGPAPVDRPLSAEGIRAFHRRLVLILLVVVPLAAAVGLAFRPARPQQVEPLPALDRQPAIGSESPAGTR